MNLALLILAAFAPFDDLSPDARKDYQRLERRLEADMRLGENDRVAASGRLLSAMRLSTRGADSHINGAPPLYGRYKAYGKHEYITIHQCHALRSKKASGFKRAIFEDGLAVAYNIYYAAFHISNHHTVVIRISNEQTFSIFIRQHFSRKQQG